MVRGRRVRRGCGGLGVKGKSCISTRLVRFTLRALESSGLLPEPPSPSPRPAARGLGSCGRHGATMIRVAAAASPRPWPSTPWLLERRSRDVSRTTCASDRKFGGATRRRRSARARRRPRARRRRRRLDIFRLRACGRGDVDGSATSTGPRRTGSRRRRGHDVNIQPTDRGDAAATAWLVPASIPVWIATRLSGHTDRRAQEVTHNASQDASPVFTRDDGPDANDRERAQRRSHVERGKRDADRRRDSEEDSVRPEEAPRFAEPIVIFSWA